MNTQIQKLTNGGGELSPLTAPPSPAHTHGRYEPYQKLHRMLRGRYLLVLITGGLLALAGAYGGWKLLKPMYRSEGYLELSSSMPVVRRKIEENGPMSNYEEYIQSQAMMMESRRVLDEALKQPGWQQVGGKNDDNALSEFAKYLTVEHPVRTELIKVYFLDPNPLVAAAAVNAVVVSYEGIYRLRNTDVDAGRRLLLEGRSHELNNLIGYDQSQIDSIVSEYSTVNLQRLYEIRLENEAKFESRVSDAKAALAMVEKQGTAGPSSSELTDNQIAMLDQGMEQRMERLDQATARYQADLFRLGENNVTVKQDLQLATTMKTEADAYAKDYRDLQRKMSLNPSGHTGGVVGLMPDAETLKQQITELEKLLKQAKEEMNAVGAKQVALEKYQADLTAAKASLADIDDRMSDLEMEGHGLGLDRLTVFSYGDIQVKPYKDRRVLLACVGGLLGGLLPLTIMVLIGLVDRRYRYSDDAEESFNHPTLLGILPNLPARLEDPQVAAIAAHCIHQVRIMLQIGSEPGKTRAFMITSGGTGDGKTSLTMALGLSFAASGSRTLMIDADIIGQALSHRMGMSKDAGLLQALVDGTVRGRAKETKTPNLWVLPAGTTETRYANVLSAHLVKTVLDDARGLFDTIIVDTGPILGSLEASVLASQVDGVVLAVSRGEQQPLVQRALNHLHALGAHVSGLVFNRAERRDFQRSVASASIRSQPVGEQPPAILAAESGEASRFGPLARSVASFIPESGDSSHGNGNGKHEPPPLPALKVTAEESSVP